MTDLDRVLDRAELMREIEAAYDKWLRAIVESVYPKEAENA